MVGGEKRSGSNKVCWGTSLCLLAASRALASVRSRFRYSANIIFCWINGGWGDGICGMGTLGRTGRVRD